VSVERYEPSQLEVACGMVFGYTPPESLPEPAADAVEALEEAILPALLRAPCLVSFSGGRDSATVLAAAVRLARREGLELPVPATNRFPGVETGDEREWQERIIVHLGLTEWLRFDFADQLDSVGPIATRALRRHGLLWPFNAHFHLPLIDEAAGGSVLTGLGGDESFGAPRWTRAASVVSGRLSWLLPDAQEEMRALWTVDVAAEPLRWQHRAASCRRRRYVRAGLWSLDLLASAQRVAVHSPFVDARFAATLAALPSERRFLARSEAMRELFGDLLPPEVLTRRTTQRVASAFWSTHSRRLAEAWDGEGVDTALVDHEGLRGEWSKPQPDPRTFLLLQAAALAREQADPAELAQTAGALV
jgi:asparagine synthetase B (glutamine-hydrolysing)